jgi:hypothetical protein
MKKPAAVVVPCSTPVTALWCRALPVATQWQVHYANLNSNELNLCTSALQDCARYGPQQQQCQDQERQQQYQQVYGQQQQLQLQQATVKHASAQEQPGQPRSSSKACSGLSSAAARAASRLKRHGNKSYAAAAAANTVRGPGRKQGMPCRGAGSSSPVRQQKASYGAAVEGSGCQPCGVGLQATQNGLTHSAAGTGAGEQQLPDLQQLRSEYAEVIGVFEDLLVFERRSRMEAERGMAQLLQQMRLEARRKVLA